MSSDFDKDALDVERHYTRNWFTHKSSSWLRRHHFGLSYALAEWLVGYANMLRSASTRDGYEWVDRRTSLFSKYGANEQAELLVDQLNSEIAAIQRDLRHNTNTGKEE